MDTYLLILESADGFPPCDRKVGRQPVAGSSSDLLARVWDDLASELARAAMALGMPRDRADDVMQDVWLTAWQSRPAELDEVGLRRWLYRVMVNRCRLEHRRRSCWKRAVRSIVTTWTSKSLVKDASIGAECNELEARVEQALAQLTAALREIVVLRYFCGFDSKQISEMLDMPDSTVRSQLRVARRQLARYLADWK